MKIYRLTPGVSDPTDLFASWAGDTADALLLETGDPFDPAFFYTIDSTQVPDMDTISNGQKKYAQGEGTKIFFSGSNPLTYIGKTGAGDQDLIRWKGLWLDSCPVEMWNMNYGIIEDCKLSYSQFRMGGYNHDGGTGQCEFNRIQMRLTNGSANAVLLKHFDATSGGSMRDSVFDFDIFTSAANAARIAANVYFSQMKLRIHGGARENSVNHSSAPTSSPVDPATDGLDGSQACVWFEDDGDAHAVPHGSSFEVQVEGGWSPWNEFWHPAIVYIDADTSGESRDWSQNEFWVKHNFLAQYVFVQEDAAARRPRWKLTQAKPTAMGLGQQGSKDRAFWNISGASQSGVGVTSEWWA